jgi:hypothetical protein
LATADLEGNKNDNEDQEKTEPHTGEPTNTQPQDEKGHYRRGKPRGFTPALGNYMNGKPNHEKKE